MNSYMNQVLFVVAVSFVFWQGVSATNDTVTTTSSTTPNTTPHPTTLNFTTSESTNRTSTPKEGLKWMKPKGENSGMLERSLYVAIGISALVAIYFIVRWVKTRGRRKAKKYGVIHGTGEPELQPLEKHTDEDEEDIALFDVKDSKRPK